MLMPVLKQGISFLSQEMTAYKKKLQNDGAPVMGGAPANQKSDSEEEGWKDDDE